VEKKEGENGEDEEEEEEEEEEEKEKEELRADSELTPHCGLCQQHQDARDMVERLLDRMHRLSDGYLILLMALAAPAWRPAPAPEPAAT